MSTTCREGERERERVLVKLAAENCAELLQLIASPRGHRHIATEVQE